MKIVVTQTRQVNPYEPLKIEVEFDTKQDLRNWQEAAQSIVDDLDLILYPKKYVEFIQDPPSEIEEDEF